MEKLIEAVVLLVVIIVVSLALAFPVMWLWNALMPDLFGLPMVTFWQAFGLQALFGALFKSSNYNTK